MKKFSITKLETARTNPRSIANSILSPAASTPMRFSTYMAWQLSVFRFHKTKNITEAREVLENYFENKFKKNKKNDKIFDSFRNSLTGYYNQYTLKKLGFIEPKMKLDIKLTSKLKITGQIPVVCMNSKPNGRTLYFFLKGNLNWEDELKFPIIQKYAENLYGINLNNIEVGVFNLTTNKLDLRTYDQSEVETAYDELINIGKKISGYL